MHIESGDILPSLAQFQVRSTNLKTLPSHSCKQPSSPYPRTLAPRKKTVNMVDWKYSSFFRQIGSPGSSPGDQVPGRGSRITVESSGGTARSLSSQRMSTPFLRAETPLKHENQKFDQKFDFEERGYFGITKEISTILFSQVAETQLNLEGR